MSSILSAVFVIYMWVVYLPGYEGSESYQIQLTVVAVTSLVMLAVMVVTLYLARGPITEGGEKETPSGKRPARAHEGAARRHRPRS
jgi:hypothetical protein